MERDAARQALEEERGAAREDIERAAAGHRRAAADEARR